MHSLHNFWTKKLILTIILTAERMTKENKVELRVTFSVLCSWFPKIIGMRVFSGREEDAAKSLALPASKGSVLCDLV